MKSIFLVLDDEHTVIDIVDTETDFYYCDVGDDVTVEEVKESLQFGVHIIKWEHDCLYIETDGADSDAFPTDKLAQLEEQIKKLDERIRTLDTALHNLTRAIEHDAEIEI